MVPATALAQTAPAPTPGATDAQTNAVDDIIVTAQKREESLQSVPVAVTAFSGDTLTDRGISDPQALVRLVPNMGFSDNYSQTRITLRGLSYSDLASQGGEPRVAYHVDGAFMAMSGDIGGSFYDIQRVEVNRGPQGTLFGRNAVAGTVNVITNNPTDTLSGYLNAEVGNYSTANVDGAISGPLGGGFSARVAFQSRNHSGYDYNVPNSIDMNNQDTKAVRAKLKYDTGGAFRAVLSADYFHENDRTGPLFVGYEAPGLPVAALILGGQLGDSNPRHGYSGQIPGTRRTSYGATLDMTLNLGDGFSLASLTNYRHSNFDYKQDDTSSLPVIRSAINEHAEQFSQELRLSKDFSRGNITLGGYLYRQDYVTSGTNAALGQLGGVLGIPAGGFLNVPGAYTEGFLQGGAVDTRGEAIFGQATYEITDTTKLIVGARYSWETKRLHDALFAFDLLRPFSPSFVPPASSYAPNNQVSYTNFSPRVTLEQKLADGMLVYATYAKGFKTGGFNVSAPFGAPYLPESLTDYEVGFKFDLFDKKLRFNGAGFYYDYRDLQVVLAQLTGNTNVNATAKLYGAEFEMTAVPVRGLELDGSLSLIHSEFTNFPTAGLISGTIQLAGNRLPSTPKYQLSYGAQYTFDTNIGKITIRGDGQTKGQVYFDQYNVVGNSQGAYTIVNASIGWKDVKDRFSVTAFVKNIGDTLALNGTFNSGPALGLPLKGSYDPPRTWGVRLGLKF
jgi:iron complex outermembrane receptor protein